MSLYKGRPFLKLVVAQKLERTLPKLIDSPSLCKKWVHAKMSPYKYALTKLKRAFYKLLHNIGAPRR
ncbi:hypothetical protein E4U52_003221 [Claviceps spartinae]|nr:hypothetical protein E4U52_003221 [Claviceps spartinae]